MKLNKVGQNEVEEVQKSIETSTNNGADRNEEGL